MSLLKKIMPLLALGATALAAEPLEFYKNTALSSSPRLRAGRASAAAAKNTYLNESIFRENPDLMVGLMNVPLNSFPALNRDTMSSFAVGISQKIALPWEASYRKEAGRQKAEAEEHDRDLLTANLIWEISEKYNALHYSYQRMTSLKDGRRIMTSNLNILAHSLKLQKNIVPQILEAKANLGLLENELTALEAEIERLWLDLEVLCGRKLAHEFSDAEKKTWADEYRNAPIPAGFNTEENLQYRKMRAEADGEKANLSLSKAALFPEVTLSAAYMTRQSVPGQYNGTSQASMGDNMITISASTPLPVFYPLKNSYEIDAQSEKLKAAEERVRETGLVLESTWRAETLKLESLARTIENYTKSILPAHSSAHKAHLATATAQGMGVSEALAAYQTVVGGTQERLKLIRDYYSAVYKLQFLAAKPAEAGKP